MNTPAYRVRGLTFGYRPSKAVLKDVNFDLPAQAVTAVLGPNATGKSTLLHLLLGLWSAWEGSIHLLGKPLSAYAQAARSRLVALVPQREHVPFAFRVREYVLLGRSPYLGLLAQPTENDQAQVERVLHRLGIASLADRQVASLSGGEHQMVLVARALVQNAPVLLLDEPTAHLDLGNKRRILHLLRDLPAAGHTVVFTTHDPQAAAHVADHILMLRGGRLLFAGPPAEALTPARLSALYDVSLQVTRFQGQTVIF